LTIVASSEPSSAPFEEARCPVDLARVEKAVGDLGHEKETSRVVLDRASTDFLAADRPHAFSFTLRARDRPEASPSRNASFKP